MNKKVVVSVSKLEKIMKILVSNHQDEADFALDFSINYSTLLSNTTRLTISTSCLRKT